MADWSSLLRALGVALLTCVGAFIAWVFIRYGGAGWYWVLAVGFVVLLSEVVLWDLGRTLKSANACERVDMMGWAALGSAVGIAVLASIGAVYLAADVISIPAPPEGSPVEVSRNKSENKALAGALVAIAAALAVGCVDALKKAGVAGTRVRAKFRRKFIDGDHGIEFTPNRAHLWATFEQRRQTCARISGPIVVPEERGDES